jgi:GAF domain-containing protein
MTEGVHVEGTVSEPQDRVAELVEQHAAISEVLRAVANSPQDLQPIFDTLLISATRLCRATFGALLLFEEKGYRIVARRGAPAYGERWPLGPVHPICPGDPLAQLIESRSPVHIADLAADQAYLRREPRVVDLVELAGVRTYLLMPLLKDDKLIGTLGINRKQVQPFTDRQIDLVTDFAAQATIALESTRRERQYREMQSELAHANRVATMGQLTASIAHEIKQPVTAARTYAAAALRFLDKSPSDVAEVRAALTCIVDETARTRDVVDRIGSLIKKNTTPEGGRRPQCGDPGGDRANPKPSGQDRRHGEHATGGRVATHPVRPGATATSDVDLDPQRHPVDEWR